MFYEAKLAVCSEIHAKHMNEKRAPCRVFRCYTWWYLKLPLGFKRLMIFQVSRGVEQKGTVKVFLFSVFEVFKNTLVLPSRKIDIVPERQ
jgi:hypothetical protein